MKFRVKWIVAASLALALMSCKAAVQQIPDVAGIYEGDLVISSSLLPAITSSASARVEVTQDGANVELDITHVDGEPTENYSLITGTIDHEGTVTLTGEWADTDVSDLDSEECGAVTTSGTQLTVKGSKLRLSLSMASENCGVFTVVLTAVKG